jgi:outer membrane protein assembly factor BamB
MKSPLVEFGIPALFGALGLASIGFVIGGFYAPTGVKERPLGDNKPLVPRTTTPPVTVGGGGPALPSAPATVASSAGPVTELPGDWPGFRGPKRDNVYSESVPLLTTLNATPPKLVWSIPLGEGYAAPAVHKGRVYVLDYDEQSQSDALRCFGLADGKEIWRTSYQVPIKRNHGISRTIPAVNDNFVVSLGPKCHLMCADAKTGKRLWLVDLVQQFGTVVPEWYAGQCPIIDGDKVIVAPGT